MWRCAAQVHERTLQGDFLMALLKDILARRRAAGRPLKVDLLSSQLCSPFTHSPTTECDAG